ncbi:MAG: restriction endonuclease subunit S [Hormoscilla sp. GUM202]|nr:restriction endonuclease subunit S [Hormoscilla sp. GUM202]
MSKDKLAIDNSQVPEGYKKTEVGVIPEDWEVKTYEDIFTFLTTASNPRADLSLDKEVEYIHYGDIHTKWDCLLDLRLEFLPSISKQKVKRATILEEGDVIMADASEDYEGIGKSVEVINISERHIVAGLHTFLLRDKNQVFTDGYRGYLHRIESVKQSIDRMATGLKVYGISKKNLKNILLPVPGKKEQRAIAQTLSDVDGLIAALDKSIAKKRNIKTATMQELLTGKKRLPGFGERKGYKNTEIGVIPEDWEVNKIGEIANVDRENLTAKTYAEYQFKYISLEDVDRGTLKGYSEQVFSTSPSRARRVLRYGDVLFSTVRPNLKSHLLFNKDDDDWVCSTGFSVLRCQNDFSIAAFLFFHLFSGNINKQIETLIAGSNYPAINSSDVRKLEIAVPEVEEQRAIASILSDMDAEIAALEKRQNPSHEARHDAGTLNRKNPTHRSQPSLKP